jgi:RNA polymerase sigma-70 factor, ECF subfamily
MKVPGTGVTNAARQSSSNINPDGWVDEQSDFLYRYALMGVRCSEMAEDLVQETLFAAVGTYTRFRGISSERSWLCGILKNMICDHFRKLDHDQ